MQDIIHDRATQTEGPSVLPLITVAEAARLLGAKPWPVVQLIERGEIRSAKIGKRIVIPRAEVERYARDLFETGVAR